MSRFEYRVIPAPHQGTKAKGVKTTEDRFALSLTNLMNTEAEDGWEYLRAETLPCDERKGLTGTQTTYQNVLVFRRAVSAVEVKSEPVRPLALGTPTQPAPAPAPTPAPAPAATTSRDEPPLRRFSRPPDAPESTD